MLPLPCFSIMVFKDQLAVTPQCPRLRGGHSSAGRNMRSVCVCVWRGRAPLVLDVFMLNSHSYLIAYCHCWFRFSFRVCRKCIYWKKTHHMTPKCNQQRSGLSSTVCLCSLLCCCRSHWLGMRMFLQVLILLFVFPFETIVVCLLYCAEVMTL